MALTQYTPIDPTADSQKGSAGGGMASNKPSPAPKSKPLAPPAPAAAPTMADSISIDDDSHPVKHLDESYQYNVPNDQDFDDEA